MNLNAITLAISRPGGVRSWDPLAMFTSGVQGVWYDPSDTTTLFRGATGTTPVTAVEQPVGLILDKSKGLVLGSELVDTANTAAAWTPFSFNRVTQDGDAVKIETVDNPGGATLLLNQIGGLSVDMVSNGWYVLTAEVKINTGSAQVLVINGGNGTSAVTFTSTAYIPIKFYVLKTTSNDITLRFNQLSSPETVWIRNISVKELPGNHAFNSSGNSANFPVLSARYNLLTKTEDFSDNSVWTTFGALTVTGGYAASPIGTNTATRIVSSGGVNSRYQSYTYPTAGVAYIFTVWVKATGSNSTFRIYANGNTLSNDLTATSTWQQFSVTVSSAVSGANTQGITRDSAGNAFDVLIWGADLRVANDALNQPAYQRVNTSTDYDTVGFKPYLHFNGTQWLQTNSIDFTNTAQMFVSAGVRKLSDAASGLFVEFSTSTLSNTRSFYCAAPETLGASGDFTALSRGSASINAGQIAKSTALLAPKTVVFTATLSIADDLNALRINGAANGTNGIADQGTGNYGNYPLYIGARAGTSLWFNGHLYGMVIAGKQASAIEIENTENYLEVKTFGKDMQYVYSDPLLTAASEQITTAGGEDIYLTVTYQ